MKKSLKYLLLTFLLLGLTFCNSENKTDILEPDNSVNLLRNPVSVFYHSPNSKYYISNRSGRSIVTLDKSNQMKYFVNSNLSAPNYLTIMDSTLYVTDATYLKAFNINNSQLTLELKIAGSSYLNGITQDNAGRIYLSDTHQHKIFCYDINTSVLRTIISSAIQYPIGLVYKHSSNSILISCGGANSPIYSFSLSDSSLVKIIQSEYDDFDGIALDSEENIYVSAWTEGKVYKYNSESINAQIISSGHNGPAGLFVNTENNTLVVPNFDTHSLDFINLNDN